MKVSAEVKHKLFPGDEELAIAILKEIKIATPYFDSLSALISDNLSREESMTLIRAVASSHGVLVEKIILPIYLKFPHLDLNVGLK